MLTVVAALASGCFEEDDGSPPPVGGDASTADALPPTDAAPSPDAPADASPDASDASACGALGPFPAATKLAAGKVRIQGVTSDGYVIYVVDGGASSSLEAVSVAGGPTIPITPVGQYGFYKVVVKQDVVAVWTNVGVLNGLGELAVWTKSAGLMPVSDVGSTSAFAVSDDGKRIAFHFGTNKFAVTSTAAPDTVAGPATAVIDQVWFDLSCVPTADFVKDIFFLGYCPLLDSTPKARVVMVPPGLNPQVKILANTGPGPQALRGTRPIWKADRTGTTLFVVGYESTQARIIKVATPDADPVPLADDLRVSDEVEPSAFLTDDGSEVVYVTAAGALVRASTAAPLPTPTTLVGAGVYTLLRESPDKKLVLFSSAKVFPAPGADVNYDIHLASTLAVGQTPVDLVSAPTGGLGDFTATGSHVFFFSDLPFTADVIGPLKVQGTASGATPRTVEMNARWSPLAQAFPSGTKVLFFDNYVEIGALGDLKVFDAACPDPPRLVVGGADIAGTTPLSRAFISGTHVAYVMPPPSAGLYVVDVK